MKLLFVSIFIVFFCTHARATNSSLDDSTKQSSCHWYCPKIDWKQVQFFGKSSDTNYRYNKVYFEVGVGNYNNPAADRLERKFSDLGYSGLSSSDGLLGDIRTVSGKPTMFGKKDIQFHLGFGYSVNKYLSFGIDFRNIPSMNVQGYVAKVPYDYTNPDLVQESVSATTTQYKVNVLLLTIEQNHRKVFDVSAGAAMVHYTFDVETQLNINQYDTTSNLQIVGQANIVTTPKVWGQAFNVHSDIYFTKNFSLQLSGDYFFNVVASIPTIVFNDGPYQRRVGDHTLNFLHATFSGGLAFHFW